MPYPDSAYRQAFVWRAMLSTPMLPIKVIEGFFSWRRERDNNDAYFKIDGMSAAARVALSNKLALKAHRPRVVRRTTRPRSDR